MNDEICQTFERVAKKMGWMNGGGLDGAEKKLMSVIGKKRHVGTSAHQSAFSSSNTALSESSDDEFDKFLVERFTPQAKALSQKSCSKAKTQSSNVPVVSPDEDDDDTFETFLQRVKTPTAKPRKTSPSGSGDSLRNFIVDDYSSDDDFIKTKSTFRVPKTSTTPAARQPLRKPLSQFNSPVFISDSEDDDDDNVVIRSTWKIRHSKPKPPLKANHNKEEDKSDEENRLPSLPLPPSPVLFTRPPCKTQTLASSPKRTFSAPSKLDELSSSEEEFASLLERLKKKNNITGTSFSPKTTKESSHEPVVSVPVKTFTTPRSKVLKEKPQHVKTPGKSSVTMPTVSQSEPRQGAASRITLCKTSGCFLHLLTNPDSKYGASFKKNKEELTGRLYQLYNTSVFDNKLPSNMSVTWNKKMRKTAGYCITGQERNRGSRYARIELSEKVCDSADRLRDTLIHEMCHAATWLINGVRDGHGNFWKLYARKSTVVHPELPMVTRCHSYDITYKFQYRCTRCENTIGRHSKSLDTQRFVCALCTGQLVLLTPSKPRAPTPFAAFVKENYGNVRQKLAGQSHVEVMRKLSADFASKTKLTQS